MMKSMTAIAAIASIAALAACAPAKESSAPAAPSAPAAQANPTDLSDFVGARGGQAEMGLQNRGYELARTEGLTAYWYNSAENDCAKIVTDNGRYKSVDKVSPSQCGASGGATASGTPTAAEQACLRDVTKTTQNPDVTLLESSFSEAGTEVIVGVGPQRARWRCIAYKDGSTAGIESLTNEGSL